MAVELLDTNQDEMQANIDRARRNLDAMIDMARLVATLRYESYRAHIDAGFTPEQALDLCKKWN